MVVRSRTNASSLDSMTAWPRSRIVKGDGPFLDKNVDHTGSYDIS